MKAGAKQSNLKFLQTRQHRAHPIVLVAAGGLTIFSILGSAAITGLISAPSSHGLLQSGSSFNASPKPNSGIWSTQEVIKPLPHPSLFSTQETERKRESSNEVMKESTNTDKDAAAKRLLNKKDENSKPNAHRTTIMAWNTFTALQHSYC